MTLTDLIGYFGSLALGISGTPQAIKVFKEGNAPGISLAFLLLLLTGFGSMIVFSAFHNPPLYPLLVGYVINFCCYSIILRFKLWPRGN